MTVFDTKHLFDMLAAYDEHSYYYGSIFCCVIGVFPVVILTFFCFQRMFAKLNRNLHIIQEPQEEAEVG